MSWSKENQARLDYLRGKELAGTLAGPELEELATLMAQVETEEAQALAPALEHLRAEVGELRQKLATLQDANQDLARLLAQQQT